MPANPQREGAIFRAAAQLTGAARASFLQAACHGAPALRQRLEALLAAREQSEGVLAETPPDAQATLEIGLKEKAADEAAGATIGRYKILEKVGEGGCGVVYVAEQTEPVRRRVALKVIKLGMDTKQVVARFEAERQALAMMDHPNIAKVLDAGTTETGRPYFIMELVRGIKITDYCDQSNLPTKERLDLFIKVCQAIQHAHQKGIIHRDIKPSNILVTLHDGVPVPKVIDFGIAKATEGRLTDSTVYTQLHQFMGTPAYMSPEQAEMSGLDIDTRSDIYSLGVLLYELLTGKTPFDAQELMSQGIEAMRKTIREKAPLRPSTKLHTLQGEELTTMAKRHGVDVPKLASQLRGDLDWMVMKCLEKDRTRRYETANGLAMDIQRHLNNEPVLARPPSKLYEFQKTFRRHKVGFAATAALILVLAAGVLTSTWQAVRATQAKQEALAAKSQAIAAEKEQSRLRVTAQKAEAAQANEAFAAQQSLYTSLVGEARATRLARLGGYREDVFKLLQHARDLQVPQKNLADLRRQAVDCLGDFVGLTPVSLADFPADLAGSAALNPSGRIAAFGLSDGTVQLRDLPSGKEMALLTGTNGVFRSFCFNSSGDQLCAVCVPTDGNSSGRRIYTWARDLNGRWQEIGNLPLPGAMNLLNNGTEVFALVVDFDFLMPGNAESRYAEFRLFSLRTGNFVAGYAVTNALPAQNNLEFDATPDGQMIAVETVDTRNPSASVVVNLYDWKTGQRVRQSHLPMFGPLSLSPDGKYLACFSPAGGAIWRLPGFERIGQFRENLGQRAAFFGSIVAIPIWQQHRIRLWNLLTKGDIVILDDPAAAAPMNSDKSGNSLLFADEHQVWLYRLNTPEKLALPVHGAAVTAVAFSPDSTRLASVDKARFIRVSDAGTGRILWQTDDLPGPGQCLGYSPDGQWLATGDWNTGLICLWNAHTGQRLLTLGTNGAGATWSAQFSPDGRYLATTGDQGTRIWSIERRASSQAQGGLEFKPLKSLPNYGMALVFSPNSRLLAFENFYGFDLNLWDFTVEGQPHLVVTNNFRGVQALSFTPDSRQFLMMGPDGDIFARDVSFGKRVSSFPTTGEWKGERLMVNNFCLSPDGSRLAVATRSVLGVEVWDPKNGKLLYSLPEEDGTVYWLAWSPDSQRLAIARDSGDVATWNLDTVGQILTKLGLNP